jgi:hypothetical protein
MDICNVVTIGKDIQTTAAKPYANSAWEAVIDIGETNVDVILKDEVSYRLAKELLAIALADLLQVPHIPGWAVSLHQTQAQSIRLTSNIRDPNDASRQLVFASKLSHGDPIAASAGPVNQHLQAAYYAHPDAVPILVFDELVGNYDRQYENVMKEGARFLAFDHDKILFGDTAIWDQLPGTVAKPCMSVVSDDIGCFALATKPAAQALAASWATQLLAPIFILGELVQVGLLADADAQNVESYLLRRVQQLPSLVNHHY